MDQDIPKTSEHELKDLLVEVLKKQETILRRIERLERLVAEKR
jgi:hypothetical protein